MSEAGEEPITRLVPDVCWALLRSVSLGRLAVMTGDRPDIFPVNFVVDHGSVVFRTAEGTKLAAATVWAAVAFEADGRDEETGEAWSVVVKGSAREITGLHALLEADELPLFPAHASPKNRFVRIHPDEITGRRFAVSGPEAWPSPLRGVHRAPHE